MSRFFEAVKLYNNADFFSAHDKFEELWTESGSDEKKFFQGLVQISVGSYHLVCGNKRGALSQYKKGIEKLKEFAPFYYGVEVGKLVNEIIILLAYINEYFSEEISNFDLKKIPSIDLNT